MSVALEIETPAYCELCSAIIPPEDVSVEAFEASGLLICTSCLEDML